MGEVERAHGLSLVLPWREDRAEMHPAGELRSAVGDQVSVFAGRAALRRLNR